MYLKRLYLLCISIMNLQHKHNHEKQAISWYNNAYD